MKRTKRRLAKADWNFWPLHNAPPEVQRFALVWEIDRTLGSGNPPYLKLPKVIRKKIVEFIINVETERRAPLRQLPLSKAVDYMQRMKEASRSDSDENYMLTGPHTTAHLLQFDWEHFSREEIKEALGKWIDSRPNYILSEGRLAKPKTGRPQNPFPRLVDLAIWRISLAGVTHTEGCMLLATGFPKLAPTDKGLPNPAKISATHWADAKNLAHKAAEARLRDLQSCAHYLGGNWRDHFARIPEN